MPNINHIIRGGHLGKDAETRYTNGGDAITKFSVATTKKWKDKQSGEMKELTDWIDVSVFGKPAEWCGSLKKGDGVIVTGEVLTRSYEKDGQKRYATEIRASEVHKTTMMGKSDTQRAPGKTKAAPVAQEPFEDDAIPF